MGRLERNKSEETLVARTGRTPVAQWNNKTSIEMVSRDVSCGYRDVPKTTRRRRRENPTQTHKKTPLHQADRVTPYCGRVFVGVFCPSPVLDLF